jgi:hypothetical protein
VGSHSKRPSRRRRLSRLRTWRPFTYGALDAGRRLRRSLWDPLKTKAGISGTGLEKDSRKELDVILANLYKVDSC